MDRIAATSLVVAICIAAGGAAAITYRHWSKQETAPLLAWEDAAVVARGHGIYFAQCAACHGANGEGQTEADVTGTSKPPAPPHNASGHTWQHPDFALFELTKTGVSTVACRTLNEGGMPRFEQVLSNRDILDVLAYIKSTWPPEIITQNNEVNQLYEGQNAATRKILGMD